MHRVEELLFERRILGFLGFSAGENVRDDHVPVLGKTVFRGFALNDDFSFAVGGETVGQSVVVHAEDKRVTALERED